MEGSKIENAKGIIITPVATSGKKPFEIKGEVGYKSEYDVYYCNGASFPAQIAQVIY